MKSSSLPLWSAKIISLFSGPEALGLTAEELGVAESGTLGVPAVMLREEKDTFLDDITTDQLAQRLGVKVEVLPTSGGDEARALLRSGLHIARRKR